MHDLRIVVCLSPFRQLQAHVSEVNVVATRSLAPSNLLSARGLVIHAAITRANRPLAHAAIHGPDVLQRLRPLGQALHMRAQGGLAAKHGGGA